MANNLVLTNDTVRVTVRFADADPVTGDMVLLEPIAVGVEVKDSNDNVIISGEAVKLTESDYYFDFTPTEPGEYEIVFSGIVSEEPLRIIVLKQTLYVSTPDERYQPTIILQSPETIYFAPDIEPLYLEPEALLQFFPDATLIEIGEKIHFYSMEVKKLLKLSNDVTGSDLNPNVIEYIRAAAACDLSRVYGFGGDDEVALKLGDFSITNRSSSRSIANRDNATTWCQLAAALRREMLAGSSGMKGVLPKGLPSQKMKVGSRFIEDKFSDDPMPKRHLKSPEFRPSEHYRD